MSISRLFLVAAMSSACAFAQGGGEVWRFLSRSYDADENGSITAAEYGRGEKAFRNLDRNRDGVITAADFERERGRERGRGRGRAAGRGGADPDAALPRFVERFATFIDRDGEPGIGAADWQRMIRAMAPADDGTIARGNLTGFLGDAAGGRMARMATRRLGRDLDLDDSGGVDTGDLAAIFRRLDADENGRLDRADGLKLPPGVGELAPDFTLPLAGDRSEQVTLSSFRGKKPVALVFGSYT